MAAEAQVQETENLALKKKARRRLVGTVALVILSLLILPQILKNKSHKVKSQDPVVIMPQEEPAATEPAAVIQPPQGADASVNESGFNAEVIAENLANEYDDAKPAAVNLKTDQEATSETKVAKDADTLDKVKEPVAKTKKESTKADKVSKKDDRVSDSKKAEKTVQKPQIATKNEAAKSKAAKIAHQSVAKPDGSATKTSETKPQQGYAVQLGVFADPENVKKMQAKIALAGFESKASTVSQGTRLRVGYFVSRKGAEQALETLKQNGLSGKIVSR